MKNNKFIKRILVGLGCLLMIFSVTACNVSFEYEDSSKKQDLPNSMNESFSRYHKLVYNYTKNSPELCVGGLNDNRRETFDLHFSSEKKDDVNYFFLFDKSDVETDFLDKWTFVKCFDEKLNEEMLYLDGNVDVKENILSENNSVVYADSFDYSYRIYSFPHTTKIMEYEYTLTVYDNCKYNVLITVLAEDQVVAEAYFYPRNKNIEAQYFFDLVRDCARQVYWIPEAKDDDYYTLSRSVKISQLINPDSSISIDDRTAFIKTYFETNQTNTSDYFFFFGSNLGMYLADSWEFAKCIDVKTDKVILALNAQTRSLDYDYSYRLFSFPHTTKVEEYDYSLTVYEDCWYSILITVLAEEEVVAKIYFHPRSKNLETQYFLDLVKNTGNQLQLKEIAE
ncbi:MAG: hypothetical protein IJA15_00600 [Clostridia bacterium]|nr:hypothetical protein [Clostridia bacterium]